MPFVVDASVAASWAFSDERHAIADEALERLREDEARVPGLWWFEIRNTLITGERRGRIKEAESVAFLQSLSRLGITLDHSPDEGRVMALARRYRLTVYDSAYLELAQREGLPLATLDNALAAAAAQAEIPMLGGANSA